MSTRATLVGGPRNGCNFTVPDEPCQFIFDFAADPLEASEAPECYRFAFEDSDGVRYYAYAGAAL